MHWDRHACVASRKHLGGNPVAFAAEDDATVRRKIGLPERVPVEVRMCGDAANTAGAEFAKSFRKVQALDHWQPENRAHRVAHGAPEKRAAGRSADEQRLDA